jgi:hypothetical protein
MDRLRGRPVGLGPVQGHALRGTRAAGAGRQQGVLGRQARAKDRQGRADPHARGQCAHRRAAGRPGRLDRGALARRHGADHAARLQGLFERAAARVALAAVVRRGLALARQARAPGGQPVHRPRRHEAAAGRHDGRAQGHSAAGPPLVRQTGFRHPLRREGRAGPHDAGRLLGGQAHQGEGADIGLGLGPDAAAAHERVRAAVAQAVLLRRAVRRHRMEHAVHQLAQGRERPVGQRRQRGQHQLRGHGPVLCDGALREHQGVSAGVEQLGLLRQPRGRQAGGRRTHQLRRQVARRRAGQGCTPTSWTTRRSCGLRTTWARARCRPR